MTTVASAEWIVLAHLLRPQGRKGELLGELLTDFPKRFEEQPDAFLAPAHFTGPATSARPIKVTGHWLPVGKNHGRIVLKFDGIESIDEAELLAGLDLIVPLAERLELEDDAEYISDLIGCRVFDGSLEIGTVESVDFPTTSDGARRLPDAAPLLTVLTSSGEEILIPYVQSFLVALSTEAKRIDMQLPPGLLSINSPSTPAEPEDENK